MAYEMRIIDLSSCVCSSDLPPLIFVPAAVYAFTQGENWAAIGLLISGFVVVINIDNVLRLIIAKRVGDIHPIITVVGVIIGIPLFGMMGLVDGQLLDRNRFGAGTRVYVSEVLGGRSI